MPRLPNIMCSVALKPRPYPPSPVTSVYTVRLGRVGLPNRSLWDMRTRYFSGCFDVQGTCCHRNKKKKNRISKYDLSSYEMQSLFRRRKRRNPTNLQMAATPASDPGLRLADKLYGLSCPYEFNDLHLSSFCDSSQTNKSLVFDGSTTVDISLHHFLLSSPRYKNSS